MKKYIGKRKILLLPLSFLIFLKVLFLILNKYYGMYFLLFNLNQPIIDLVINILLIITVFLSLIVVAKAVLPTQATKVITIAYTPLLLIIILIFTAWSLFWYAFTGDADNQYYYFKSPLKTKTLVVEECSWLTSEYSNFYVRKGILIQNLHNQIWLHPFSANDYKLKWLNGNTVELTYNSGAGDRNSPVYKTTIIHLK
ncbi:MAG: hypothetical protein PHT78_09135 [Desulfitobacteriaceae bacterium]|nr:hypothetical protein [Desulfitobacteriaceae bacterium]